MVLFQNRIDYYAAERQNNYNPDHLALVQQVKTTMHDLYKLKQDCIDLIDTFKYLREKHLSVPKARYFIYRPALYKRMAFELLEYQPDGTDNWTEDYGIAYRGHQRPRSDLAFVNKAFRLYVPDKGGRPVLTDIEDIDWDRQSDWTLTHAIRDINTFLVNFPTFRDNFIMQYVLAQSASAA